MKFCDDSRKSKNQLPERRGLTGSHKQHRDSKDNQ